MSSNNISVTTEQISQKSSLKLVQNFPRSFTLTTTPERATAESLCFVSNKEMLDTALQRNCKGFIVLEKALASTSDFFPKDATVWSTPQINFAMSEVLELFDPRKNSVGIHPTAVVHPTAQIGKEVTIHPYVVVEQGAVIGANTILYPHSYIAAFCKIGQNCIIGPQTVVGSDGFGYFTDRTNTHHKIPQIGIVVIEDNCELGAQCAIDRATLTETKIGKGTKIDNFSHIAHNCEIGENGVFAAGFMASGSTKVGKNVTAAGAVHTAGHLTIGNNIVMGGRAGITHSIDKPGIYSGFPVTNHKENLRMLMTLTHLPKMRKQLNLVLKKLGLDTTAEGE